MRYVSIAITALSALLMLRLIPLEPVVSRVQDLVRDLGAWGPLVLGSIYVVAALLFVPGSALTLAAGALYGLWIGVAVVSLAATTTAALAFSIGRYLARARVERAAKSRPRFAALDSAVTEGGWKVVLLLRLSPMIPFGVGNYLFGLTGIRFWPYVLASSVGMLPGTFMYVSLGHIVGQGLGLGASGTDGRSPLQWTLLVVGLLATIGLAVFLTYLARKELRRHSQAKSATKSTEPQPPKPLWSTIAWGAMAGLAVALAGCGYAFRDKLFGGPPRVVMQESHDRSDLGDRFDHSLFTSLLEEHVREGGWVDYESLNADLPRLDAYIAALARAPFDELERDEQLAFLLNAYNAFTLRLILDQYPIASIKDIPEAKRWKAERWRVGPHIWSLDQIEHEQIRPKFREARIHFALVCAAVGCPPLRRDAYTGPRIEEQLEEQAVHVHTHDRWFRFDPSADEVHLTELYDWYRDDFEQVKSSVLEFAAQYAPELRRAIDGGARPRIRKIRYDWKLNSVENAQ